MNKLGKNPKQLDTDSWASLLYREITNMAQSDPQGQSWLYAAASSRMSYLRECYSKARPHLEAGDVRAIISLKYEVFRYILQFSGVHDDYIELNKLFRPEKVPAKYKLIRKNRKTEDIIYNLVPADWQRNLKLRNTTSDTTDSVISSELGRKQPILRFRLPIKPSFFLGRKSSLADIHRRLTGNEYSSNLLLLHGVGGMGKTTLMQQYLNTSDCQQYFDRIVFAAVDKDIANAFINGAAEAFEIEERKNALKETDERMGLITGFMSKLNGRNLFVLDNISESDYDELVALKHTLEMTGWKFLITTRTAPDGFPVMDVDELSDDNALLLFAYHYFPGNVEDLSHGEREQILPRFIHHNQLKSDIYSLLKHIVKHTLLTELLAKSGRKKGLSVKQLLEALKEDDIRHEKVNRIITIGQSGKRLSNDTLYNYMLGLFETEYLVKATGDKAIDFEHERQAEMLRFFSLLPPNDIPVQDLCMLWDVDEKEINAFEDRLDQLRQIGWLQGKTRDKGVKEVMLSLQGTTFKMHPLIQTVVYDKLAPNLVNCSPLVRSISRIFNMKLKAPQTFQHYAQSIVFKLKNFQEAIESENSKSFK